MESIPLLLLNSIYILSYFDKLRNMPRGYQLQVTRLPVTFVLHMHTVTCMQLLKIIMVSYVATKRLLNYQLVRLAICMHDVPVCN